ncbi:MAG: cysteine--tRNA ligase [Omnitrophica WOR_2 bacterium RIFCSPHIGHO2_02_FULL_68_15]|nr:MAG: cysteine--tRNA ligase [Omnitrophica WOR_2 bacterium RIFCSPHIGHO2_02_FULL_68_15]
MPVALQNSLTQTVEPLVPLRPGAVGLYACGVTVYDDAHLGHLRAAYVFEVLRRVLQHHGHQVTYIRNVTDVDDKIIEKARAEAAASGLSLKAACKKVADTYLARYQEDLRRCEIPPPDKEPKATEHIPQMLHVIKGLVAKDHAYVVGGDVYFRVRSFPEYGKLSHQSPDELRSGARIAAGERKDDPLDFTLWKAAKPEEPAWDSPWGAGRPGWHIECSAMSMTYLGESFDLHGGGRDLIFPHHENEIAQSEAATGRPFARCWVHSGLVTVGGHKMAKSVGNVVRVPDLLARQPNPDILKLLFLMTHYSSPLDFTWEKLEETATAYQRFITFFDTVESLTARPAAGAAPAAIPGAEPLKAQFDAALANNLNTSEAVAALFELVRLARQALEAGQAPAAAALTADLKSRGAFLGLFGRLPARRAALDPKVQELVEKRDAARRAKDFKESDRLRQELHKLGLIVEDTSGGTVCRPA